MAVRQDPPVQQMPAGIEDLPPISILITTRIRTFQTNVKGIGMRHAGYGYANHGRFYRFRFVWLVQDPNIRIMDGAT
jgi:hypothetical protein